MEHVLSNMLAAPEDNPRLVLQPPRDSAGAFVSGLLSDDPVEDFVSERESQEDHQPGEADGLEPSSLAAAAPSSPIDTVVHLKDLFELQMAFSSRMHTLSEELASLTFQVSQLSDENCQPRCEVLQLRRDLSKTQDDVADITSDEQLRTEQFNVGYNLNVRVQAVDDHLQDHIERTDANLMHVVRLQLCLSCSCPAFFGSMEALEASQCAFLHDLQEVLYQGRRSARIRAGGPDPVRSRSRSPPRGSIPPEPTLSMRVRVRVLECDLASALHRLECFGFGATALLHTLHQEPDHSELTDGVAQVRQELSSLQAQAHELRARADASESRLSALEDQMASLRSDRD
ncbi:unnamed protein product [Symbiodinium sp. CCMP2592]|nr:unnamed protein product [Symbiodinium sp. CCMP2592]